jgi:hypothetical protein
MKKTLLVTLAGAMLMASSAFAGIRFGVGVNVGVPVVGPAYVAPAPVVVARPFVAVRPPMPGPGYVWVDGFNGPTGWVAGYWAVPPYPGAFWVGPRFVGGRFAAGYWGGARAGFHEGFRAGFRR